VIQPSKTTESLVGSWLGNVMVLSVDYRELYSVAKPDLLPSPRINGLLDQLGRSHYFPN